MTTLDSIPHIAHVRRDSILVWKQVEHIPCPNDELCSCVYKSQQGTLPHTMQGIGHMWGPSCWKDQAVEDI